MKQISIIIITLGLLLIWSPAFSQTSIIVGIGGGANLSTMKYSGDFPFPDITGAEGGEISYSRLLRYQGGIDLGIQFGKFGLITGAHFNQRGDKIINNAPDPNGLLWVVWDDRNERWIMDNGELEMTRKFNLISIPILLRYQLGSGAIKFNIMLGPQVNMGMGSISEVRNFTFRENGNLTQENQSKFGKGPGNAVVSSHVSFVFSPGVSFDISDRGQFKLSLMLDSGANLVNKNYIVGTPTGGERLVDGTIRTRALALEVGYEHRIDFRAGVKY